MKSYHLGLAGAVIAVVAAFLLGLSLHPSSSSPQTGAAIQARQAATVAPEATQSSPPPIQPPQVIQLEITVRQEPGPPQVIEVRTSEVLAARASLQPSTAGAPRAAATPTLQAGFGIDPRGPRVPDAPPSINVTPAAVIAQVVPLNRPPATATPNPCAGRVCATVRVDFAGSGSSHANVQASCNVAPGSAAWDCIKQALGLQNIKFDDFGGNLGVFISGLYGVAPDFGACSCFWEFDVNGASSNLGVSGYIVHSADILGFKIGH